MEQVVKDFLSTPVGEGLALLVIVVVGVWLREWTYRNTIGSRNCWNKTRGADLRREDKERKQLQKEIRKKYRYLNKKKVNK